MIREEYIKEQAEKVSFNLVRSFYNLLLNFAAKNRRWISTKKAWKYNKGWRENCKKGNLNLNIWNYYDYKKYFCRMRRKEKVKSKKPKTSVTSDEEEQEVDEAEVIDLTEVEKPTTEVEKAEEIKTNDI